MAKKSGRRKVARKAVPIQPKPSEPTGPLCPACTKEMLLVNESSRYKMFNCQPCGLTTYLDKKKM